MSNDLRIRLAHAIREASGLGLQDVRGIMDDAESFLDGDHVLASLVRHAHGFSVSVKSPDPSMSPAQARRDWDIRWARSAMSDLEPGRWDEVRRLSAEMKARR
jgi:hypothetical protein